MHIVSVNFQTIYVDQEKSLNYLSVESVMRQLAEQQGVIPFYNENDPFTEWLGNFYPISVACNGFVFLNSEAAFQAQKFIHHPDLMAQFVTLSGEEAFHKARELKDSVRSDWLEVRVDVMKGVLQAKMRQNPRIASWLNATGLALLVEHNEKKGRDDFWSDDFDGTGRNMLGKLWMEVRDEMRESL